jgi:primosomal protein N' (replication factor Y) (superfamily II helicase)
MTRVCRVVPDVTAVERVFDYLVPDELAKIVRVGTIVRAPLQGRRVRAWVVEDDVEPDTDVARLLPLHAVSSEGPPADVVDLTTWVATRWCGPRVAVLRSASPPNRVQPDAPVSVVRVAAPEVPDATNDLERAADDLAARVTEVLRWPPLLDRRRLVERVVAREGSTILAVADGARASALVDGLRRRGYRALLLHSDAPPAARTQAWDDARRGSCVVVGGRVVAFAPIPDLASVVVVDDADEALQEERVPTWHARDVLAERARCSSARFTVLSAAPSTHAVVRHGDPAAPPRDVERRGWPHVEVIDRRADPPGAGLYSAPLVDALRRRIDDGAPAVCVLNRRGRARLLACDECRSLTRWDRAGAPAWSITANMPTGSGEPLPKPVICPHCGSTRLRTLRAGVTRSREELAALLRGVDVAEVDASIEHVPDAPVLVGTESVLHRAEVRRRAPGLVAFLDFDAELLATRYRAAEQALWLLVRAAQLAMRRGRDARLLVQTRQPEHEVIVAAREADPSLVVDAERRRREALGLPPFVALAELSGDAPALDAALSELQRFEHQAAGVSVLGPLGDGKDVRALVRAADDATLSTAILGVLPAARGHGRLRVAVDPSRV